MTSLKIREMIDLPDGEYQAKLTGYNVNLKAQEKEFNIEIKEGISPVSVEIIVKNSHIVFITFVGG